MTATGREAARNLYGDFATPVFLPYDLPWAVRRFVAHFRPRLGVIMETELWPNLVRACREAGVPVLLANARMSEKSARGYASVGPLARAALEDLAAIGAQSAADAERLAALGAHGVELTGNLKFDVTPPAETQARAQALATCSASGRSSSPPARARARSPSCWTRSPETPCRKAPLP
jgi:3-deoxy-D-manno-octulosonic-acid transferase